MKHNEITNKNGYNEIVDIDKKMKNKWRQDFKEGMVEHQKLMQNHKYKKLKEEKEYLNRVQKELEIEKMKNKFRREKQTNDRLNEYQIYVEKKKVKKNCHKI
jgi:hypothetical protein